ncbi:MAG: tetratricopeptide repeat protein [Acetobacteraceae bacterium]|nr:tetratricopeptide repeat protein [Acetobacteraceae bacterium]
MIGYLMILALLMITLCGASAAAMDTTATSDGPDLSSPRAAIAAKDYVKAATELKPIAESSGHPDAYSLLGFALRKSGQPDQAALYYNKALELDPVHKATLEYQGELFVELGQLDNAKQNLAKLDQICTVPCEEAEDLKEAIEVRPPPSRSERRAI